MTLTAPCVAHTEAHGVVCAALSPGVILVHYARKNTTVKLPFTQGSHDSYRLALTGASLFFLSQCVLSMYDLADLAPPLVTKLTPPVGSLCWNALRVVPDGSVALLLASRSGLQVYRMAQTGASLLHSSFTPIAIPHASFDVYGHDYLVFSFGSSLLNETEAKLLFVPLCERRPEHTLRYWGLPMHVRSATACVCGCICVCRSVCARVFVGY